MNRLQKYKDSLYRFIKDKSSFIDKNNLNDQKLEFFLLNEIKSHDMILPIILLTTLNSKNKKNNISMQCYYFACIVEFMTLYFYILENKKTIVDQFSELDYIKVHNKIIILIYKLMENNIESMKNTGKNIGSVINVTNIILNTMNSVSTCMTKLNKFHGFEFNVSNSNCHSDVVNWYLKSDNSVTNEYKELKRVSKECINEYINMKYTSICEVSLLIAWVAGCGDIKKVNKIKEAAEAFSIIYKLSLDFKNMDNDIKYSHNSKYTKNYVLNFGLENGYELFLNNKKLFIEIMMILDIYTNTLSEIIDNIEENIDFIIDQTSPDIKSQCSNQSQYSVH